VFSISASAIGSTTTGGVFASIIIMKKFERVRTHDNRETLHDPQCESGLARGRPRELDVEAGRKAAYLAALNVLAVARQHLGSLDKVTRIVRLGVSVATSGDIRDQPKVADAASELLRDVFGKDKSPCRLVYGVASLPLGTPVELEVIFEVAA
jgi:enamine deaminase RidA (YjgF/YER057c/UK114 family)